MADGANPRARPANRRAIGVTCAVHRGPRGFFDPHVTGECVIILDEDQARVIRDAFIEWLG
ncbi:MAG: hypothetical protein ACRDQY_20620 [Pseudonocardiaceae bacterium]